MKETQIRTALVSFLKAKAEFESAMFSKEVSIRGGAKRADLVAIAHECHCFELKSDVDNLNRLFEQACSYSRVFEHVTLVCHEKHVQRAQKILPGWLNIVKFDARLMFEPVREGGKSPFVNAGSVVSMMRSEELKGLLITQNMSFDLKGSSVNQLSEEAYTRFSVRELLDYLRFCLKSRAQDCELSYSECDGSSRV